MTPDVILGHATAYLPDALFYLFAGMAVAGAIMVPLRRNPMDSAVSLAISVLSIAALYVLLSAHFLAAAQMIVYAGAVVVLFIFVILLLNLTDSEIGPFRFSFFKMFGFAVALTGLGLAAHVCVRAVTRVSGAGTDKDIGSIHAVANSLFGEFLLPFELAGVLILAAMIAGVVLAKRDLAATKGFSLTDWLLERFSR